MLSESGGVKAGRVQYIKLPGRAGCERFCLRRRQIKMLHAALPHQPQRFETESRFFRPRLCRPRTPISLIAVLGRPPGVPQWGQTRLRHHLWCLAISSPICQQSAPIFKSGVLYTAKLRLAPPKRCDTTAGTSGPGLRLTTDNYDLTGRNHTLHLMVKLETVFTLNTRPHGGAVWPTIRLRHVYCATRRPPLADTLN